MLKMNNYTILNAFDLKEHFSAWDALAQLEEAAAFVRIHCLPLVTVLKSRPGEGNAKYNASGQYAAVYLEKSFWLGILAKGMKPADWEITGENVIGCMQAVLKEAFSKEEMAPDEAERLQQEYADAMIGEKLLHIAASGKLTDSREDVQTTVLLLALCELAEVDVFQYSFQRWDEERPKPPFPGAEYEKAEHPCEKEEKNQECEPVQAEELPNVAALQLKARRKPYSFCCYARDELNAGDQIRVVRIDACAGRDPYGKVAVRLVHPETKQILRTVEIPAGEYRDCTAVNGRIIKFLPTMAVSKNLCVVRNPAEGCFEVVPFGSNAWRVGMDPNKARSVTCLAAGDVQEQGFLFVADGKVISSFYKPAEDHGVRMDLQMIFDTIVEAAIEPEGYCLLTGAGTVISDIPKWNGAERVVSLSGPGKGQDLRIEHPGNVAEAVMSVTGDSLVIRDGQGQLDVIFGDDPTRSFQKSADGSIRISSKGGFADE